MTGEVKIVPALCTQCGGTIEVNAHSENGKCPYCGTEFIIEKAINNYNVQHATIEHADNINIDVSGSVKTVLSFVGEQIKEGREARKIARKEEAERERVITQYFFKIFGMMFAAMMVFAFVSFIIMQFTDTL